MRTLVLAGLKRLPRQWDVLICEMAQQLAQAYRGVARRLKTETFYFTGGEVQHVAWMLARGWEVFVLEHAVLRQPPDPQIDPWHLDEASAATLAARTARECFDPLLRKYVEDARNLYPNRRHADLERILVALERGLGEFLGGRCMPGGDLHACLADPLGAPVLYFRGPPYPEAMESSGNPALDVYRIGIVIGEEETAESLKAKLIWFARTDPWLWAELRAWIDRRIEEASSGAIQVPEHAVDQATDDFLFRATRLEGRTPIQLLISRQLNLPERQRDRLLRWDKEAYSAWLLVTASESPFLVVRDLATDQQLRVRATRAEAIANVKPGVVLFSRVVPWEDHWLLSGVQRVYGPLKERELRELEREILSRRPSRPVQPDDPEYRKRLEIQQQQYKAWVEMLGSDEVLFHDGLSLAAAVQRFTRHWSREMVVPETGRTRAQEFERTHGRPAPEVNFTVPEPLLEAKDVGAIFHPMWGLGFYVGYGQFRNAFATEHRLSEKEVEAVWGNLLDETVEYWLFERMRERYPRQTEQVMRTVLGDPEFQLERDFERVLRKFKGEQMRRPIQPTVTILDNERLRLLLDTAQPQSRSRSRK